LRGDNKDDNIIGGRGNDTLFGGAGDDMYYFDIVFGKDRVYDSAGVDSIVFSENVKPENIELTRNKTSIYITRLDDNGAKTNDIIQIDNFFEYNGDIGNGAIEKIVFQNGTQWDINKIIENLAPQPTQGNDNLFGDMKDNILSGLDGDDTIYGGNGNDTINGDDGNDILYGDSGDDTLEGGAGNDNLQGGDGNDTLIGGADNDTLYGGYGDDTYIFNIGDENDTISDGYGSDTIKFGEGISKDDLIIKKTDYYNLKICFKNNSTDSITLNGLNIENFEFANGDKLSLAHIQALPLYASDESETIYGYNDKANIINALGGDDTIYGGNGDTITGGTGNDNLQGGYGNDTYIFSKGDGVDTIVDYGGSDTIKFNDFNQDDIKIKRELASLIITSKISDDKITIQNFFDTNTNTNNPIEKIIFKDSSEWNLNEILKNAPLLGTDGDDKFYLTSNDDEFDALSGDDIIHAGNGNDTINGGNGNDTIYAGNGDDNVGGDDGDDTLYGDNGDDTLYGGARNDNLQGDNGNDTLIGGTGNDTLNGGNGDDTYIYNLGDGVDTITETNGNDTIKFGEGITKYMLVVKRDSGSSNHLVISIKDTNDSIRILWNYNGGTTYYQIIENFEFADGTKLSFRELEE